MDDIKYFSARDIVALLDAESSVTLGRSGSMRVVKAGIKGTGKSPADAAADWCRQFAEMVTLPREASVLRDVGKVEVDEDESDTDLMPEARLLLEQDRDVEPVAASPAATAR
jgi:hypothetical protein